MARESCEANRMWLDYARRVRRRWAGQGYVLCGVRPDGTAFPFAARPRPEWVDLTYLKRADIPAFRATQSASTA